MTYILSVTIEAFFIPRAQSQLRGHPYQINNGVLAQQCVRFLAVGTTSQPVVLISPVSVASVKLFQILIYLIFVK